MLKAQLVGHLGQASEMRITPDGQSVTSRPKDGVNA